MNDVIDSPDYQPKNARQFEELLKEFFTAEDHDELMALAGSYVFDTSFAREDILIALKRSERARGWSPR